MKKEHQLLYNVMKQFEGIPKIEVFDLLYKMEVLLLYAKSPLKNEDMLRIIQADGDPGSIDQFQFTILPNGNFCELQIIEIQNQEVETFLVFTNQKPLQNG